MSIIKITKRISSRRSMITLLNLTQTIRLFPYSNKPVHILTGFLHNLLNRFHTLSGVRLNTLSLPLNKNRITKHLMSEKHSNRMTQKIILNLLMNLRLPVRIPLRQITATIRNIRAENQNIISLRHNIQIQTICPLINLLQIRIRPHQRFKKIPARIPFILLHLQTKLLIILHLRLLMLITVINLLQTLNKRILRNRLQKIILNPDINRLLRIIKIIIPAKNHNLNIRQLLLHQLTKRQPVHKRHLNIRNQKIRLTLQNQRQRHLPIRSLSRKLKPILLPGNHLLNHLPDHNLILYQKRL